MGAALARDQRTVVDSLDFRVDVVSPIGDTLVPLESERLAPDVTPLTVEVCSLLLETERSDGIGAIGVVVDCVVVELEDELCAAAKPATNVTAIVAASNVLIISCTPGISARAGSLAARLANMTSAIYRRQARKLLNRTRHRDSPLRGGEQPAL
jgi:hypothetical protein